ncbi:MAG TPA: M1 family metallopeptidase [Vicinamibacterales bacterium]|nr:M1 family metallopeptidase [Vicinamibacterales bacterium]
MSFISRVIALGAAVILAIACNEKPVAIPAPAPIPHDPSSYANTDAFVIKHLVLDLTADFDARTLSGTAELRLDRRNANATELVLDTRDLTIRGIEAAAGDSGWKSASYRLDPATPAFGSALRIAMPKGADRVRITYSSSPSAKGLQWLTPAQTAGRKHPFLFSQAQAIQARSFIPLQDLPGVRATYDATIHTSRDLVAVMAAEKTSGETGGGLFHFRMPQPIPSYLIALAVGDLAFKSMSERTGVWAEPSVVDAAAHEFEDTEKMMKATEALYGRYRWGRYDLLVLPPSFPFGGMENPRLTFATPTVIVGDRSLVSLVAHELAHSWSGNLVTNATWTDFWLNEGFTTYLERRIVEVLYGRAFAQMEAAIGVRDLKEDRAVAEHPGDRTLQPDLAGRDPDDATSRVPYEQGALFLTFLESKVGRNAFDRFLRQWFDEHAFKSATTQQFLTFLHEHLLATRPGVVTDAQIQEWLHTESIPAFAVLPQSDAFTKVEQARDAWLGGGSIDALATNASKWSTQEWIHFIDSLPRRMEPARLSALDRRFTLTESQNAEIAHVWYRLAIANHYTAAFPAMERYMIRIGRRKLIVPLYRDLAGTAAGKALASEIYARARDGYHPMTKDGVEGVLRRTAQPTP